MTVYLDTHVLLFVLENELGSLSRLALETLDKANLLVSPIVMLELEYLYEIERTYLTAAHIRSRMERDLDIQVCGLSFPKITEVATREKWTRDPFDRLIVAHAKANGYAPLITADRNIREHYPEALW